MSVPLTKRQESRYEVVNTAYNLYRYTVNLCIKMPRRYTYLILQPVVDLAGKVADYVRCGVSVTPTNLHEAQMCKDYFIRAQGLLNALIGRANILMDCSGILTYKDGKKTKGVTAHELEVWGHLMNKESELIKKCIKYESDIIKQLK